MRLGMECCCDTVLIVCGGGRSGKSVMRGSSWPRVAPRPRDVPRPAGAGGAGARKECVVFASGETNAFKRRGYTMAA